MRSEGCGTRVAGAAASSTAGERSWNFSGAGCQSEIDVLLTGSSVYQNTNYLYVKLTISNF